MKIDIEQWSINNSFSELSSEPEHHYGKFLNLKDAESWLDAYRQDDNSFTVKIAQFRGNYYLID